jgi:PTS system nitrogen regulatory IIA component
MVDITRILERADTSTHVDAHSRKRALEAASDLLAANHPELSARALFDELMNRERLGSTALGEGVAIPHCRMPCQKIFGAFLKLEEPVDYDAPDGTPVDLLFVLVVPPEEKSAHLEVLALLARLFQDPENRRSLRDQPSDAALYEELVGLASSQAA